MVVSDLFAQEDRSFDVLLLTMAFVGIALWKSRSIFQVDILFPANPLAMSRL